MYFGWNKVSKGFHLASTWLTGLGATISAWWILVANAWMQHPVGCAFNPDTMRNEMVDFLAVALSPFAVGKFFHTVISAWIIGAVFVVAVSSWYLWKKRELKLAKESIKIAAVVGLIASLGAAFTGHISGQQVAQYQPMKMAAIEGLHDGGTAQGLALVPGVEVPYALSIMATNDPQGYVPGINDILNGYTTPEGKKEPSVEEKIQRGKEAITALAAYRKAKKEGASETTLKNYLTTLNANMQYMGYGYVKDLKDVVPPVAVNFWAFRVMVGAGCLFILYFLIMTLISFRIPYLTIITRRLLATFGIIPETEADSQDIAGLPAWRTGLPSCSSHWHISHQRADGW